MDLREKDIKKVANEDLFELGFEACERLLSELDEVTDKVASYLYEALAKKMLLVRGEFCDEEFGTVLRRARLAADAAHSDCVALSTRAELADIVYAVNSTVLEFLRIDEDIEGGGPQPFQGFFADFLVASNELHTFKGHHGARVDSGNVQQDWLAERLAEILDESSVPGS